MNLIEKYQKKFFGEKIKAVEIEPDRTLEKWLLALTNTNFVISMYYYRKNGILKLENIVCNFWSDLKKMDKPKFYRIYFVVDQSSCDFFSSIFKVAGIAEQFVFMKIAIKNS